MAARLAFLDFEASGLDRESWPIEAGVATSWGKRDAFFIQRHESWSMGLWCRNAALIHGISPADLEEFGIDWGEAIERLERAVEEAPVYSDAAQFDQRWLELLCEAAGREPPFEIRDWEETLPAGLDKPAWAAIRARAGAYAPRAHRAGDDAAFMLQMWRLAWAQVA